MISYITLTNTVFIALSATFEIKSKNRFHIENVIDLEKITQLLKRYEKPLFKGIKFYRARISGKKGHGKDKMGNPPPDFASAGRANPKGISYLYLANDIKTTLYETRAALLDYVSIGKFELKEEVRIVDLRGNSFDPVIWAENGELEDLMIHKPFFTQLEDELAKSIRRSDRELDYLPSQYLSEYIKTIGLDGIISQSSLYKNGYNLVIFSPEKFECINAYVHEVTNIEFTHKEVE